ncbi:redoxin domain-containing protein [Streptomyces sp. CC219B]|uniref:redoxin domain-containing protein n=1 Tax=Streptomyces sp. CC219B TaxID=3044574 RepID=UPI0024A8D047|nr:redoxin domain-containing protein [Streptomyces sp. CC219B]
MSATAATDRGPVRIPSPDHDWTVLLFVTEPGIGEALPRLAGCTTGLCSVRDEAASFARANARVLGVSAHPPGALGAFARERELGYPLVGDEDLELGRMFGVPEVRVGERTLYERAVVVLDRRGRVRSVIHPVPDPARHAASALKTLAELARAPRYEDV